MENILKSASKIVFVLLTIAIIIGFFMGLVQEDNIMLLVTMVFGFYFANKGDANAEYLGK